jgi:pyruvate formate lyase activating enzyme
MHSLVFDIQRFSIYDGPGIRTTVFFKGCPLSCLWCQNPESIARGKEILFNEKRCVGCKKCKEVCKEEAIDFEFKGRVRRERCNVCGKCADICCTNALRIAGRGVTVQELVDEVKKDIAFYKNSGGGITLSGGEPLLQSGFSAELLRACKEAGINTCIETSGFTLWSNFEKVLRYTDLVLYDIKIMNVEKHQKFTGVKNEIILQNALRLAGSATSVNFRMPLIPEHNDDEVNIAETAEFLKRAADVKKTEPWIHILPYHRLGVNKYEQLGKNYALTGLQAPSKDTVSKVCEEFRRYGVKTAVENN